MHLNPSRKQQTRLVIVHANVFGTGIEDKRIKKAV